MCYGCRNCGKCGKPTEPDTARMMFCATCGGPQQVEEDGSCMICGKRIAPAVLKPPGQVASS